MPLQALIDYTLHLGDDALIMGHRNSEWTGHGPILEQDIALSNIALDLIGQARNFYQFAAERMNNEGIVFGQRGGEVSEDMLAYLRDVWDFRNCLLAEQANGDWAKTVLRQFFFSAYQYYLYRELQHCREKTLAAIAEKSLKEVTYHLRWSSEWVIRLGDGTEESHGRMARAMGELWNIPGSCSCCGLRAGLGSGGSSRRSGGHPAVWEERVREVLTTAQLKIHEGDGCRRAANKVNIPSNWVIF